ncbi:MAG: c-type cytochrome [Gallionella sp.]|nr:c-type cytochrome [Gallionella sp.]
MKVRYLIVLTAALAVSSVAFAAEDGEAVFNKNKCAACHKLDAKTVGPSIKAVAAKYAGNKEAAATLEKKVRTGGAGVWGSMPMPRVPATVPDEEIKSMVAWILAH